jgi:glyoxylase-like metal-dependent hydrolase (beta-lactamase superfamily II)
MSVAYRHQIVLAAGAMLAAVLLAVEPGTLSAQTAPTTGALTDSVLPALRRAATMVPGEAPRAVRYLAFNRLTGRASDVLEGGTGDSVPAAHVVFQIAYDRGWLMVDAGMDRELAGGSPRFSAEAYARVQQALRGARLIVLTHEHSDHVAGVIRSPFAADIDGKTLLTRAQVQTLLGRPDRPQVRIDSARASRFLRVDYDHVLPIAPGVALLRAAGHTPGSQMVYVRLATGREVILAGDVAWAMAGVEQQRQKPAAVSRALSEDRTAVGAQLAWLHRMAAAGVAVVVAHDAAWLTELERRGVLHSTLDVQRP